MNNKLSNYQIARKAKAEIHAINRIGWPTSEDGIRRLLSTMEPEKQTVCRCGRFIRKWDGWHFLFPSTSKVVDMLDGLLPASIDYVFLEDEEG